MYNTITIVHTYITIVFRDKFDVWEDDGKSMTHIPSCHVVHKFRSIV